MSWISAQIKIKMCLTKCWEQIFDFAKFFGFLGLQRSKNEILPQFSPYLTPKIWKFSQNQKSVPNILWDTFWSWLEPKFTTFGQFARDLLTFLRFLRLKFGDAKWLCPRWRDINMLSCWIVVGQLAHTIQYNTIQIYKCNKNITCGVWTQTSQPKVQTLSYLKFIAMLTSVV